MAVSCTLSGVLEVSSGVQIDVDSIATTLLFTTPANRGDFHFLGLVVRVVSKSGTNNSDPNIKVGTNSANYDNLMSFTFGQTLAVDSSYSVIGGGTPIVVPPSTDVKVRVNGTGGGTTFVINVFVVGFYA